MTVSKSQAAGLIDKFLCGRNGNTAKSYRYDLEAFARFLHVDSPAKAVGMLLGNGQGRANAMAYSYVAAMRETKRSPTTINRRLACLKSYVKLARLVGMVTWGLDVPRVKIERYTDTAGPGVERIREIFADLQGKIDGDDSKAVRDMAILRLLFHGGLRCHEVVGVDLAHYDAKAGRLSILGKGRSQREWVTLSPKTDAALVLWLKLRGDRPGPLFVSMRRGRARQAERGTGVNTTRCVVTRNYTRIIREDIYRLLHPYGVKPHGFRHTAITAALDVTQGDVRAVQKFSRHRNLDTLLIYDDARRDIAGKVAAKLDDLA